MGFSLSHTRDRTVSLPSLKLTIFLMLFTNSSCFIFRKPSSDQLKGDGLDQIDVAMDIIDNEAAMDIKKSPNFSLGFDFLWEVVYANRENTENDDSSKDKSAILKQRNELSKETFTKIRQCSNQTSEKWYQLPFDPQARNKGFVVKALRPSTTKQIVVPLKVTKSNICDDRTVISGQRHTLKNPLTLQNKSSLHNSGQHSSVGTHAKMQVVTPSCRPNNLGSRPAISHLLTVRYDFTILFYLEIFRQILLNRRRNTRRLSDLYRPRP